MRRASAGRRRGRGARSSCSRRARRSRRRRGRGRRRSTWRPRARRRRRGRRRPAGRSSEVRIVGRMASGGGHTRVAEHAGEADEEDGDQEDLEGRVEDDRALQRADVARRVDLHEEVRPHREAEHGDGDGARVGGPGPRLARRVETGRGQELGPGGRELLEHRADAAVELPRQIEAEGPCEDHHEHPLQRGSSRRPRGRRS